MKRLIIHFINIILMTIIGIRIPVKILIKENLRS